jgi:hypothetical protein
VPIFERLDQAAPSRGATGWDHPQRAEIGMVLIGVTQKIHPDRGHPQRERHAQPFDQ